MLVGTLVFILGAALAFKIYSKLTTRWNRCYTNLAGKTVIVTGANSGIGFMTAMDFAKRGARVILACRNKDRAEEAQRKIVKATDNVNVIVKLIDMTSLDSVRNFAKDINENEARLDILVNNAGALFLGNKTTADGLQITMQVNHFSMFLLVHLLLDKMKQSAPSRIVVVSSNAAKFSQFTDVNDINIYPETLPEIHIYARSKLCNIFFTTVLANKLQNTGVTVNALHPGVIVTPIINTFPLLLRLLYQFILNLFVKTSEEGAQTTIYVAISKDIDEVNGKFFDNCNQIPLYKTAKNESLAQAVWNSSEELVKLRNGEKIR